MHYSQVVSEGRIEKIKEIAEIIVNSYSCKVISHPSAGMIMVKHIDPVDKTSFYLGEVFVTQCEAEVDGKMGYGCVLGDEPERALYGALIDSVLGNNIKITDEIDLAIDSEEVYLIKERSRLSKKISKTKVSFDVKKG